MNKQYIAVSSITYAYKAKDILQENGIKATITRTPQSVVKGGCGYSLQVNGDVESATEILRNKGIKVVAVH